MLPISTQKPLPSPAAATLRVKTPARLRFHPGAVPNSPGEPVWEALGGGPFAPSQQEPESWPEGPLGMARPTCTPAWEGGGWWSQASRPRGGTGLLIPEVWTGGSGGTSVTPFPSRCSETCPEAVRAWSPRVGPGPASCRIASHPESCQHPAPWGPQPARQL